jgi:DNA-binding CsgD family transcriptional regulator
LSPLVNIEGVLDMTERRRRLTPRERQVLDMIDSRIPRREIAAKLGISYGNVNMHARFGRIKMERPKWDT